MSLTFVVPTIPGRESLLSRCLWSTTGQATTLVVDGTAQLGDKINAAAQTVTTEYMAVVDDDDYIAPDYVESVTPLLGVDYVGFNFLELVDGRYYKTVPSTGDNPIWGARSRGPVAKCPIRTDIARQVRFGNDYKADRRWSRQALDFITSSEFADRTLYIHDWWPSQSAFGTTAEPRDIGTWPHGQFERLTLNTGGTAGA